MPTDMPDMTTSAIDTVKGPKPETTKSKSDAKVKKRNDEFRTRIDICKTYRRKLIANWTVSIDYRRGKPFPSQTDDDQVSVNLDWTYTKAKTAALFSQVPQARLVHTPDTLPKSLPWIPTFERLLNDKLVESGISATMEECLPDCINASGIGVALVSYEAITEDKDVPKIDISTLPPELQQEALTKGTILGQEIPTTSVPSPIDHRYVIQRISPADFLWPINFMGSDFNNAPWIGRTGRVTWDEALQKFNLKESDKESVLGEDHPMMDRLTHDVERDKSQADNLVSFDEIFYREFQYNSDAKSFTAIRHLVFIPGKDEPVVDEAWAGQKIDVDGALIGVTKFPIQVLTLAYLTDEAIPPSDSAIGRPQVNELNKGRSQQIRQRDRSLPVRWVDVNRVDPTIMQSLMRGTWQAFIPVQGEGTRVIGEVSRASMPTENYLFDNVAKTDLRSQWGIPATQQDEQSKESNVPGDALQNHASFNTQLGKERAKTGAFFCALAEICGGLMCLYEDPSLFGEGFDAKFSKVLKFAIMTDSTVLLDAGQRLNRLNQFMNTYGKSGWVSLEPVMCEIASLVGLDPGEVITAPQPKPPVEPNISLRLTGVEDMLNPLTLAFLLKSGQAPTSEQIEQAKQLIQQAVVPPVNSDQGGMPGQPQNPPPGPPVGPTVPGPPPGTPTPDPQPPRLGEANPRWTTLPTLSKHTDSGPKKGR